MENLVGQTREILKDSTTPHIIIKTFYDQLFDVETGQGFYDTFEKLVKLFGRDRTLHAILILATFQEIYLDLRNHEKVYLSLLSLCKKLEFEGREQASLPDLSEAVEEAKKKKPVKDKRALSNPFKEEDEL